MEQTVWYPSALWAGLPGETVCIRMLLSRSMDDRIIKLSDDLQPSCELTLRVSEIGQPPQGAVISSDDNPVSVQVLSKMSQEKHHWKEFSASDAVIAFGF